MTGRFFYVSHILGKFVLGFSLTANNSSEKATLRTKSNGVPEGDLNREAVVPQPAAGGASSLGMYYAASRLIR
jgi:hypothetical protein